MDATASREIEIAHTPITLQTNAVIDNTEIIFPTDSNAILTPGDGNLEEGTTYITLPFQFLPDNSAAHNLFLKNIASNAVFLDASQLALLTGGAGQVVVENVPDESEAHILIETEVLQNNADFGKPRVEGDVCIDMDNVGLPGLENTDSIFVENINVNEEQPIHDNHFSFVEVPMPIPEVPASDQQKVKRGPGRPRRDEDVGPPLGKGPFICEICGKEFPKWAQMRKHVKCHSEDKPHICSKCTASFNVQANLVLHMATHNINDPKCPECGKKFTRIASLKAHIMLHEKEESLFCFECGDEFSTQAQLDNHKKEHAEEWRKPLKFFGCRQCYQQFTRASALREHMREHYKVKASLSHKSHKKNIDRSTFIHKCEICNKFFQKPSQLLRHKRIHTGERPFKCQLCPRAFNQKSSVQIHMSKHNGIKPFNCEFCSATFSQKGNLRAHILRVHSIPNFGEQVFKCLECPCVFKKLGSLNAHLSRMHYSENKGTSSNLDPEQLAKVNVNAVMQQLSDLKEAAEPKCEKLTNPEDILQQALVKSGLSEKNQSSDLKEGEKENTSPEKVNDRKGNATNSVKSSKESGSQTNYITLADKSLDGTVRRYIIRQRRVGAIRWHQCSYCSKEFKKPSDLVRHIRIHTHERPYKCSHCFRSFAVKSTLTAHVRTHTGLKEYTCFICLKEFSSPSSLKVHLRVHTGNKPFLCPICNKAFRTTGHRKAHILSHNKLNNGYKKGIGDQRGKLKMNVFQDVKLQEPIFITEEGLVQQIPYSNEIFVSCGSQVNERPYKCNDCTSSFRKSSHLKQHIRMHTGERPYKCSQCEKCFISSGVLKAHCRTHDGVKLFECTLCNNSFSTNGSLKRHMATHSDSRPFMCPYCHKTFKTSFNCRNHMKVHRPELALRAIEEGKISGKDESESNNLDVNSTQFTTDGIAPDFSQAFSDQPFSVAEHQDQAESDFAQNTLVQTLASDELTTEAQITGGASVITHTLHADASGTITLPQLEGQHTLTQENIQEIERTLNEQIFGGSNNAHMVVDTSCPDTLAITDTETGDLHLAPTATDLAVSIHHNLGEEQVQHMTIVNHDVKHSDELDKVNKKGDSFGATFVAQNFDACVFSAISLPNDPLSMESLNHDAQMTTNMANILPQSNLCRSRQVDERNLPHEMETIESEVVDTPQEDPQTNDYNGSRRNKCTYCGKGFKKLSHLKVHIRSHTGEKLYSCNICSKKCVHPSALRAHMKTHTGEKDYSCQICDYRFTTNGSLIRHMMIHTDERPFTCNICSAQYRTYAQLRKHIRLHAPRERFGNVISGGESGRGRRRATIIRLTAEQTQVLAQQPLDNATSVSEKVLIASAAERDRVSEIKDPDLQYQMEPLYANQCKYCPKSFRKPSDLVRHVRIHTGERPYQCTYCNKCFTVKSTLDSHMKTHGGQKMFSCHVCECLFSTKGSLKVHMRLHTGAKPFKCPICDARFRTSGHRKAHIASHTKEGQKASKSQESKNKKSKVNGVIESVTQQCQENQKEQLVSLDTNTLLEANHLVSGLSAPTLLTSDGSQIVNNFQLQLADALQVDESGNLLTTQALQLDDVLLQQFQANNIIIQTTEDQLSDQQLDTVHFEIHTNDDASFLNIQQSVVENSETAGNIIFNVEGSLSMEVVDRESSQPQIAMQQFQIADCRQGGRSLVSVSKPQPKCVETIERSAETEDDMLVFHDCSTCGKWFMKPSQLERHNRIHTGEQPFGCHICNKRFNQKNTLSTHLKSHSGERPFHCPHCERAFTQKGNLKTHMRRAHRFSNVDFSSKHMSSGKSLLKSKSSDLSGTVDISKTLDLDRVVDDLFPQMQNTSIQDP